MELIEVKKRLKEKYSIKKMCSIICVTGLLLLNNSCNLSVSFWNPYTVTNSYVVMGKEDGYHKLAGAYIDVLNNSDKTISTADVSFMLYDSMGKPAGYPSSNLTATIDLNLLSGEETEIIIGLDGYVGSHLDKNYTLDFVHFTKINYEDGTCWIDPLGVIAGW